MKNRTSFRKIASFVIGALVCVSGVLHAGEFEEAKKQFKEAFRNGSTSEKVQAIKDLADTGEKKGYAMIFNQVMKVSEDLWDQKVRSNQNLDKDKKKIQDTGVNVLKKIDDTQLLKKVFEATALGGDRKSDNIVRRWIAKKANFSKRLGDLDTGEATELLLRLIQKVENEHKRVDRKMENGGNNNTLREKSKVLTSLRDQVSSAISRVKSEESKTVLIEEGLNHASVARQEAVARTMAKMDDSRTKKAIKERLGKSGSYRLKVLLVRAVKERKIVTAESAVADHLKDQPDSVIRAAAEALTVVGTKESIPKLIEALKPARGRTAVKIGDALAALTPMDFGEDHKQWKEWWKKNKDDDVPVEEEKKKHRKKEKQKKKERERKRKERKRRNRRPPGRRGKEKEDGENKKQAKKHNKTGAFFRHEIKSHKIGFIIDVSGSMKQPANLEYPEEDDGGPETPDRGSGKSRNSKWDEYPEDPPEDPTKLEAAQYELNKAIWGLKEKQHFNIIFFSNNPQIWRENTLVKATGRNKKAAIRFVKDKQPNGSTNVYDSIEMAFKIGNPDENTAVDTIFLLTDGMPNKGKYTETGAIIKNVNKMNDVRKVKINTVVLGSSRQNAEFLRRLAHENDGNFRDPSEK